MERLVARVTLAFFDRYILGRTGALAGMAQAARRSGIAALDSGGQLPGWQADPRQAAGKAVSQGQLW